MARPWYQRRVLLARLVSLAHALGGGQAPAVAGLVPVPGDALPRSALDVHELRLPDRPRAREAAPWLDAEDEADRSCIQLYDVVARAAPLAGREVLEVGCGRGGGAAYVARYLEPRRMVAVDLSPRAVALCRARFDLPGLSFEVGDAERLPFADASFDAVLNVESSHCYGHLAAFLRRGAARAAPGRRVPLRGLSPRATRSAAGTAALRDAGFELRAERDLTPGVVAALDADDDRKRALIARARRPAARRASSASSPRSAAASSTTTSARGAVVYRAFALSPV